MTEEQLKEQLAFFYFCLLASRMGCKIKTGNLADGTDVEIERAITYIRMGRTRHFALGKTIEVQLKATTVAQIRVNDSSLKYDLNEKNFNDLVFRQKIRSGRLRESTPMLLILFVLPVDQDNWVTLNPKNHEGIIGGSFYWYVPPPNTDFTKNKYKQRIYIPVENHLELSFFVDIFEFLYET